MSAGRNLDQHYLGVDGGQSSTTALIANGNGEIIGIGRSGPCNHISGPAARTRFLSVMQECLSEAARPLGQIPSFAAACFGLSGGAEDKSTLIAELIITGHLKVTHDAEIAFIGATEGLPGIAVIGGTGSIAFGRDHAGRIARAGGWGYIFGDEGGAFDLVRRALRASLAHEEGWGPATRLRERLLAVTQQPTANVLLHHFYGGVPRGEIAAWAPLVNECAAAGDTVATAILQEAARKLAVYAAGVHSNLFHRGEVVPVAYIGGVFRSDELRNAFRDHVQATMACPAVPPRMSPAAGALLEALRMDGNDAQLSGIPQTKT